MLIEFYDMFGDKFFEQLQPERDDDENTIGHFKGIIHQLLGICPHHQSLSICGADITKAKNSANIFDFRNTVIVDPGKACDIKVRFRDCQCITNDIRVPDKIPPEALDDFLCRVCFLDQSSIVTLPCSHLVCCQSCFDRLKELGIENCAACRADVDSFFSTTSYRCPCKCAFVTGDRANGKKENVQVWCKLCGKDYSSVLFTPCGHLACCTGCTVQQTLTNCPVCNKHISSKVPVYRV